MISYQDETKKSQLCGLSFDYGKNIASRSRKLISLECFIEIPQGFLSERKNNSMDLTKIFNGS